MSKLPGVGPYITNAFLSFFANQKAPIIDRNAVRLWSRVFKFEVDAETHKKNGLVT